jgi:membrane protein implicated in regulation of membrane protease activity
MIEYLTNFYESLGPGEQLFFIIGLISNILFFAYVALQVFGNHHDADHDDADFTILSIRSLLAFGMFLGWTGLFALRAGWGLAPAILMGAAAGSFAAWLAWRLIRLLLRLQSSGTLDVQNAYGQTASVYLRIPARQSGKGKVMIAVQGALREMDAVTEGDEIPTGAQALVTGVDEHGVLIVQQYEA